MAAEETTLERVEKLSHIAVLLDNYGKLLTKRQQEALSLFYEEDLSLAEIAQQLGGSRQAIHDLIHRGEKQLLEYEAILHNAAAAKRREIVLEEIHKYIDGIPLAGDERKKLKALLSAL